MSIEVQRRAIAGELASSLEGTTVEDYARRVQRLSYMHEFTDQLPKIAPTAWQALLDLRTTTDPLVTPLVQGEVPTDLNEAVRIIEPYAKEWCRSFRLSTATGWLELLAADALAHMPVWDRLGVEITGFGFFDELFVDIDDDEVRISVEKMEVHPRAKTIVYACPGFQTWDMLNETGAQFRNRAIAEYSERLDQQIARAENRALTPAVASVNHEWIRWTLLRRAEGMSVRAIAQMCGVSRPAVNKGIKKVSDILGFSDPATDTSTS